MIPQTADLILVRGGGPIQHAIEWVSHSPYSHCAGIVKPGEVIEAQGFRDTGYAALDSYDGVGDVYTCDIATDEQRNRIVEYILSKCGTRYRYGLLGWEAIHYLFGVDLPVHDDESEFDCSQLWYEAYKHAGIDLLPDMTIVSPGDLAQSKLLRKVGSI